MCEEVEQQSEPKEANPIVAFAEGLHFIGACEEACNQVSKFSNLKELYKGFNTPGFAMWFLAYAKGKAAVLRVLDTLLRDMIKERFKQEYPKYRSLSTRNIMTKLDEDHGSEISSFMVGDFQDLASAEPKSLALCDSSQWITKSVLDLALQARVDLAMKAIRKELPLKAFLAAVQRASKKKE